MFHKTTEKTKTTFPKVVWSVLVVKMHWKNIKMFVLALMVYKL